MKLNLLHSSKENVRLTPPIEVLPTLNEPKVTDAFEGNPPKPNGLLTDAKKIVLTPLENINVAKTSLSFENTNLPEQNFIANPTVSGFFQIAHDFTKTMNIVGHRKYKLVEDISVKRSREPGLTVIDEYSKNEYKLEHWHQKNDVKMKHSLEKTEGILRLRHEKIEKDGPGLGGKMTRKVGKAKSAAFYAKNNLTIRGNLFKLTHTICPKNIYEIMPRYGYRKGAHIGIRVTQFTLTSILTGLGYGLMPVTFGISKIVAGQATILVTLSGEVIAHKVEGADNHKCAVHAGLRGLQLELPYVLPIAGQIISIAENVAFGSSAFGIVSTTLADMLLSQFSERYTSTINLDDLGDSRCIAELNNRIDYLSQFMLPYGKYLLLKETDFETRVKLIKVLKENFALLRDLEKKKTKSLNFYRLALAAEKIPASRVAQIRADCENALPDTRVNTHRIVKQCQQTLIANDFKRELAA